MARNEEKAQSMLNRFLAAKEQEKKPPKRRRPFMASQCRDVTEADKWRSQILRDIGKKVQDIQNPGYDEHRLREMNDDINKLIREKWHWEQRIAELGGPDYRKSAPKVGEEDEAAAAAAGAAPMEGGPPSRGPGYRYFGAAKLLPGVKELFEKPKESRKKRSRHDMYKCIDAYYFGYRDEEMGDGLLLRVEKEAEEAMRSEALRKWLDMEAVKEEAKKKLKSGEVVVVKPPSASMFTMLDSRDEEDEELEDHHAAASNGSSSRRKTMMVAEPMPKEFVAHVPLPDEKEIERMVVEKKRSELLSKYVSDTILVEQSEAKEMLNIKR